MMLMLFPARTARSNSLGFKFCEGDMFETSTFNAHELDKTQRRAPRAGRCLSLFIRCFLLPRRPCCDLSYRMCDEAMGNSSCCHVHRRALQTLDQGCSQARLEKLESREWRNS